MVYLPETSSAISYFGNLTECQLSIGTSTSSISIFRLIHSCEINFSPDDSCRDHHFLKAENRLISVFKCRSVVGGDRSLNEKSVNRNVRKLFHRTNRLSKISNESVINDYFPHFGFTLSQLFTVRSQSRLRRFENRTLESPVPGSW